MVSCKRTIVASSGYMLIHPLMVQRWFRRVTVFAEGEAREEWQERRDEIGGIDEASVAGFPLGNKGYRKRDYSTAKLSWMSLPSHLSSSLLPFAFLHPFHPPSKPSSSFYETLHPHPPLRSMALVVVRQSQQNIQQNRDRRRDRTTNWRGWHYCRGVANAQQYKASRNNGQEFTQLARSKRPCKPAFLSLPYPTTLCRALHG